ncbi:pentapeptide repeat-containing protein, partial [Mycobacterium marinum]|uniref:pentapeptide repeat-containing protein n=2 Tax=Mycobacterium marinum TaxID=1781 RepID=UPI0021C3CA40
MPNASVGAPPVRDTIECSPTPAAAWVIWSALAGFPDNPRNLGDSSIGFANAGDHNLGVANAGFNNFGFANTGSNNI